MTEQQAVTKYINIIHKAVQELHAAYPESRVYLRIEEIEANGWQCYIEMRERDVVMQKESFYINPPGV